MKKRQYCYHITDGMTRSALTFGTVTAESMEAAAIEAARRDGLEKIVETTALGEQHVTWFKDGRRRSVYILHDPT